MVGVKMLKDFFIMLFILIGLLLWHPWVYVDPVIENSLMAQLEPESLSLREQWRPFGIYVEVWGTMNNTSLLEIYIGNFSVGYISNHNGIVRTIYGNLSTKDFEPIFDPPVPPAPPIEPFYHYKVGDNFTAYFNITPSVPIKAYETNIVWNASLLEVNFFSWGNYFNESETFQSPSVEIDNEKGLITDIYEVLLGDVPGSMVNGTLFTINFTAIGRGSVTVFPARFGVTDKFDYLDVTLDKVAQTWEIGK